MCVSEQIRAGEELRSRCVDRDWMFEFRDMARAGGLCHVCVRPVIVEACFGKLCAVLSGSGGKGRKRGGGGGG